MGYAFVDRKCQYCNGTGMESRNRQCKMCSGTGITGSFEEVPDKSTNGDKEFGDRLRKTREKRKCGFTELANLLNCKVSHVSKIETGIIMPTEEEKAVLEGWMKTTPIIFPEDEKVDKYEIRNAIIEKARLEIADHGVLTVWLDLDYGGLHQSFGGYVLYLPEGFDHHSIWGTAGHFIYRILRIADVEKWNQLPGKTIRVKQDHCSIYAIGHIVKDDWFCPKDDFQGIEYKDVQNIGSRS